jgi:hypothetical protein
MLKSFMLLIYSQLHLENLNEERIELDFLKQSVKKGGSHPFV